MEAVNLKICDHLLNLYNKFIIFVYNALNEEEKYFVIKIFSSIRDKVINSYQVLKVPHKYPTSCIDYIFPTILEAEDVEEADSEEDIKKNPINCSQ